MSAKEKYEAALQRANAKEAIRAAKRAARLSKIADQAKIAMCHPDRPAHAHGLCEPCYSSVRFTGSVPRGLSEDAQPKVEAIVQSGVIKRARTKTELRTERAAQNADGQPTKSAAMREVVEATGGKIADMHVEVTPTLPSDVNLEDPAQRKHLANCILLRGMNFEAGIRTAYPKLKPSEAAAVAFAVQSDKTFQGDIQEAASSRGISDADKAAYLAILWRYASSIKPQDYTDRGVALRLLGKVFLPENTRVETMQNLPLLDLKDGLQRMGLDQELPLPDTNDPTGFATALATELDDEAAGEEIEE